MSAFTLDTAGAVVIRTGILGDARVYMWSDLSPFEQGYTTPILEAVGAAFRMLAPETLAAIMKDCASAKPMEGYRPDEYAKMGAQFWANRQSGLLWERFPPQTPTLGDDGKVYLRAERLPDLQPGDDEARG